MIGVTLLAAFTTGVSSLEATTVRQLRAQFPVKYVVTPLLEAVPPPVVSALAADRRLDVVALQRVAARRLDGDTVTVAGAGAGYLDAAAQGALTEPVTAGSLDRLKAGTVAVSAELAAERGLAPGGTLRLVPPTVERPVSLTVVAVLGGNGRSLLLSLDDHRRLVPGADERVLVSAADGSAPPRAGRRSRPRPPATPRSAWPTSRPTWSGSLVLGLVFAWVALGALAVESGLGDGAVFSVPWAELGTGVAAAALVGLLASVVPGRQAARVEVAAALTAAG